MYSALAEHNGSLSKLMTPLEAQEGITSLPIPKRGGGTDLTPPAEVSNLPAVLPAGRPTMESTGKEMWGGRVPAPAWQKQITG